jgi:orotidine-5'-phosphate decarboxylase
MTNSSLKDVKAHDRLILALDTPTLDAARVLIDQLRDYVGVFKVGLQLFSSHGPALFETLHKDGVQVFFDGKFHDIPNTVAGATEAIVARGVWMFNVHASGGSKMMKAAVAACETSCQATGKPRPKAVAVTVLTSIAAETMNGELGVGGSVDTQVRRLALLARQSGMDGVVASAAEVPILREACGPDFLLVTPGVRPQWSGADDQARIVTPYQAIKDGSDYLVIGRPIVAAQDRVDAAKRIAAEVAEALS